VALRGKPRANDQSTQKGTDVEKKKNGRGEKGDLLEIEIGIGSQRILERRGPRHSHKRPELSGNGEANTFAEDVYLLIAMRLSQGSAMSRRTSDTQIEDSGA